MPKEQISQLTSESWIQKEIFKLKSETLFLVIFIFSTLGLVLSYYFFTDTFSLPFTNIAYKQLNETNINIRWDTKVPVKARVEYGTSQIYLNDMDSAGSFKTNHVVSIKGLIPGKDHYFRIVAEDSNGEKYITPFYLASK